MILSVAVSEVWDTNNFEIWFQLEKMRFIYLEGIDVSRILDVLVNNLKIRL